ncbi:MAG: toll/interleukin-1 receptor domain-containing protein [Clostridia bacterium]|nr:toll/interleukin-1 receptor domain-containing protein [Clostridia bacterium]
MYRKNTGNAFRDVFISYKNDNAGNNFASRLTDDLEEAGYSVYFNSDEQKGGSFPERLRENVQNCKDFVLIVSQGCLDQLLRFEDVDWIREELLTAHESGKHIIPVILENVKMPSDEAVFYCKKEDKEYDLRFLIRFDYVFFTEKYKVSPFEKFTGFLNSRKEKDDIYRDVFNDNPEYDVWNALCETIREAEQGSVQAMYRAGIMFYYGYVSENGTQSGRDFEKAAYWLLKVAESQHELSIRANLLISKMFYAGVFPQERQSYFKTYEYLKKAESDLGSAGNLAYMQKLGLGCEYDYYAAIDYYEKIIDESDDLVKREYAEFLYSTGQYAQAISIIENMESLPTECAYMLGKMYLNGVHVDPPRPDFFRANYYFQEAADRNHVEAAMELAKMSFRPFEHHRRNFPKALRYFTVAADEGNAEAQYMLGYMYENGHVSKDIDKAIQYYETAAAHGYFLASLQLATLYQQPQRKNYHKAYRYAKHAADNGSAEAQFILGNLLLFGRGCQYNIDDAYAYYKSSWEHGFDAARIMLDEIDKIRNNT